MCARSHAHTTLVHRYVRTSRRTIFHHSPHNRNPIEPCNGLSLLCFHLIPAVFFTHFVKLNSSEFISVSCAAQMSFVGASQTCYVRVGGFCVAAKQTYFQSEKYDYIGKIYPSFEVADVKLGPVVNRFAEMLTFVHRIPWPLMENFGVVQ